MKKKTPALKNGSWTSSQWYSDHRIGSAPRYWNPGDLETHLAYITEQEIELLKKQGKQAGNPLKAWQGPSGLPLFATADTQVSNTKGGEETAKNVPAKWKSSADHPMARLVYVTDEQAQFLKKMDIHGSGVDKHDHYGPDNVPSYQGDGGDGTSDSGGGGYGGGDSSYGGSNDSYSGVSDPGETASNAADAAAAAAAADAAANAAANTSPDYNFDSPVGFDPGPAPAPDYNFDSPVDFDPGMSPAQAQAALDAAVAAAAPSQGAMYNSDLSYADLQTLADLGLSNMDVPGYSGQTVGQALAAQSFHGYMNENIGTLAGLVGGPAAGLVATIGSGMGRGLSPLDVGQQVFSSIAATTISNALGLPVSSATVNSLANGQFGQAAIDFAVGNLAEQTGLSPSAINAAVSGNLGAAAANAAIGSLVGEMSQTLGAGALGNFALGQAASASGAPSALAGAINESAIGQAVNAATSGLTAGITAGDARGARSGAGAPSVGAAGPSVATGSDGSGSDVSGQYGYLDPLGKGLAQPAPLGYSAPSGRRKKYDYLGNLFTDVSAGLSTMQPRSSISSVIEGAPVAEGTAKDVLARDDASTAAFIGAKNAGATDEEALAAAEASSVVVGGAIPTPVDTGVGLGLLEPVETSKNAQVERLAEAYANSLGKTVGTLDPNEVDAFIQKVGTAVNLGGASVLQNASIQDILSGNYASTPTDARGFRYDERGIPIISVSAGLGEKEKTDVGTSTSANIADAIVESVGGLEGTGSDVAKQGLATLLGAFGEQVADISTGLGNMGLVSRENAGVSAGRYLEDIGKRLELPETKQAVSNWVKGVSDEPTYYGKLAAGVKGAIENPLVLTEVAKEVIQEALPVGVAAKIVKFAGISAGVVADTLLNSLESAGSTGRQKYAEEIEKGTSPAEAARIADRSAGAAGLITMATSGIVDAAVAKKYGKAIEDFLGKKVSSAGKEFGQESVEEGLIALATGDSLAEALTKSVVGGFVGAKTSGSIQTAADVQADLTQSFASQGLASTDGSFKPETIVPVGSEAEKAIADSAAGETAVGQDVTGVDVAQAAGKDANVVTAVGENTTTAVDPNANVTTQTTVDPIANTQTTVVVDANANTNTQTVVNTNTNTATTTTVDTNSNITTQTTIDSNTQITVLTDPNTDTQTTIRVNTDTGEIIDLEETKIPTDWKQPVVDLPKAQVPPTESVAQPESVRPSRVNAPTGMAMLGGALGAPLTNDPFGEALRSRETEKAIDPLARVKEAQAELERDVMMNEIDPRLLELMQQRAAPDQQTKQFDDDIGALAKMLRGETASAPEGASDAEGKYYSYGSEDSIDDILAGSAAKYKEGGFVEPLKASGGMILPLMSKSGGALGKYSGREDFKDGKHVAGKGDGQSDDIPAWLADGEFVFPADVVSALGNGSTKAGTDKLYEMMHGIRDRSRSKGSKDLPPPALKSPLDYLKSSKRSAK